MQFSRAYIIHCQCNSWPKYKMKVKEYHDEKGYTDGEIEFLLIIIYPDSLQKHHLIIIID